MQKTDESKEKECKMQCTYEQKIGEYCVQIGYMENTEDTLEDRLLLCIQRKLQSMISEDF